MAIAHNDPKLAVDMYPYSQTSAAELIELVDERYEKDGTFDKAAVWEIIGRFKVREGLASGTAHFDGEHYVDTF